MRSTKIGSGIGALLLFVSLSAAPALAAGQLSWRAVGQIGGPTRAVAVQGHYAYVGVGLRLVVLDVSDPAELREVGVTRPFPHFVEDVAVSGTLAYVAAGGAGLRVVDISNPAAPNELGALDSRGYANGIVVAGSIAYLADGPYGLRVVDVSKPSQPVEVGSAYPMNYVYKVAVQGRVVCIAAAGAGMLIADVTDPGHPVEVGSLATTGYAYGVAVAGNIAYIADGWEGVKIVNVADPAHPFLVGAYKTPGWAFGVAVSGNRVYVADAFGGLRVLGVADPSRPVEVAHSDMPGGHAGLVVIDAFKAYVADRNFGLRVISLVDDSSPVQVGFYQPMAYADSVAVAGNYAYVAAGNWGFAVVDISEPTRPTQVASLLIDGSARDIAVSGNYAYVSTIGPGAFLYIIDISDPTHPVKAGIYDLHPGQGRGLDVVNGIAYIADELGLDLVSVADPHRPVRLAFLEIQPETAGMIADGKRAYVAADAGGLIIVDVSDPSHPFQLGATNTGINQAWDLAQAGNLVYIADHGGGLHVVDASDPARPAVVGFLAMPLAEGVSRAGNLAYVADGDGGLQIVDVSDATRPSLAGSLITQGYARQVVAADGRLYLADGPNGLLVIEQANGGSGKSMETPIASYGPMIAPFATAQATPRERGIEAVRAVPNGSATAAPSVCLVTSVADSGAGTLRECLAKGQGGGTITFDPAVFPPSGPATIRLASPLPAMRSGNTTIDGRDAGVIIDGGGYTQRGSGISLQSESNTIKGLQILGFPDTAISIEGGHNVIGGDRSRGRGPLGEANLISGNGGSGIAVRGADNVIVGNLIGTDLSGTKAFGNGYVGVFVTGGAHNRIGGTDPRDRNIVSGNTWRGITINGPGNGNLIVGNYVGTDISGTISLGNLGFGISIELGGFNNVVQGNLCSGNQLVGVEISDPRSSYNAVIGNRIGTDATGTKAIPNGQGVNVGFNEASFNRIGGMRPEERNLISGNGAALYIQATGNLVRGNYVGTDITGRQVLANRGPLSVSNGTHAFVEGNVIGGNGSDGVNVSSSYGYFGRNFIGADSSGQTAIPNNGFGLTVTGRHNIFQANIIANNRRGGISIEPLYGNTIRRNWIYDNAAKGIRCSSGCTGGLAPPALTSVTSAGAGGMACASCVVEIFSDTDGQGRIFEGSTVADTSGLFTLSLQRFVAGPNVTATATDSQGNTSEFSVPHAAPPPPPRRRAVRP
jgi:hypothetical protein